MELQEDKSKEINLADIENHRKNIRQKKAIITDITPKNQNKVIIKFNLVNGDYNLQETILTKDIDELLEYAGFERTTDTDKLIGEIIKVEYEDDNWFIDKEYKKSAINKGQSLISQYKHARKLLISSLIMSLTTICSVFIIISSHFYLLPLGFIYLTLLIQIVAGINYQNTVVRLVDNNVKEYASIPLFAKNAYDLRDESELRKYISSLIGFAK